MARNIDEPVTLAEAAIKPKAKESFNALWASLFLSGRASGKAVLICSAGRRAGASTVACGLALAGSRPGGARVALVDMDMQNPSLHEMLGVRCGPGVAEIASAGLAPESVVQRINAGLDLYAAGEVDSRGPEVLGKDGIADFLKVIGRAYDYVLADTAAVNDFPDAAAVAATVKEVVLVAHTEQTPREAVARAKRRLESRGAKVIGLVLNMRAYPIPWFLRRRP